MKTIILTLACILISVPAGAGVRFNDLFDGNLQHFNDTADRVSSYYAEQQTSSDLEQKNELQALATNLNAIISTQHDNPLYWFLKGLNENNLAELYHRLNDAAQSKRHIEARNRAYQKAVELDGGDQPVLSAAIYATIKQGAPDTLKIQAIQRELELGGNGEDESYYWYLHWSNVNALQQAGRKEDAELALANMKEELKQQGVSNQDYQQMVKRVQQELENPLPKQPPPPPNLDRLNSTTPVVADEPSLIPSRSAIIWIVVALSLVIMVSLAIYEIVFRSRK